LYQEGGRPQPFSHPYSHKGLFTQALFALPSNGFDFSPFLCPGLGTSPYLESAVPGRAGAVGSTPVSSFFPGLFDPPFPVFQPPSSSNRGCAQVFFFFFETPIETPLFVFPLKARSTLLPPLAVSFFATLHLRVISASAWSGFNLPRSSFPLFALRIPVGVRLSPLVLSQDPLALFVSLARYYCNSFSIFSPHRFVLSFPNTFFGELSDLFYVGVAQHRRSY